jgi:hypothetical protein
MLSVEDHTEIASDLIDDFGMNIAIVLTIDKNRNLQLSVATSNPPDPNNDILAAVLLARISCAITPDRLNGADPKVKH